MTLVWPWLLLALPAPWLLARWLPPLPLRGRALRLPRAAPAPTAAGTGAGRLTRTWAAWLLLVLAAARPEWVTEQRLQPVSGRDLMLAVDVSASMGLDDLLLGAGPVRRLDAVRMLTADFLRRRNGDRVGLLVFGSEPYLHTPLTWDLPAIDQALAEIEPGLAGRDTAIGDAVGLAVGRLQALPEGRRVLVLISDGAQTGGNLTLAQAGWLAQRAGVTVHTVGVGAAASAADVAGEQALADLAATTGGVHAQAADAAALASFYTGIEQVEPALAGGGAGRLGLPLYPWLAALAGLLWWAPWRRLEEQAP